jgi:phage shock protein PspC (stress-responsive transcriptional regulator)
MKKVININFQGRVVPIEESAYEILKKYTESLSRFFANEEGKDEIINDIEGRIGELFAETLKKGSTCISDDDINKIIASMGRPEDFEVDEINVKEQLGGNNTNDNSKHYYNTSNDEGRERTRLYRDGSDKILGGVCGGIAHYLRVDASIIRILFVLLFFGGGTGFLIYLLLWVILPTRNLQPNFTKRLYRNPDEKVLGGVASGLAAYFNIAVWIPRLIFAFPLVLSILNSISHNIFWNFHPFPSIIFGSFGGSLTLIYFILWIVIPEAKTASEKLEMRGDKIDLNSIKNTIQDDLEGFKERAEKYGAAFGEKAKKWGEEMGSKASTRSSQFSNEVNYAARSTSKKIGHGIGIFFKAFFLFIAGMIAFALLMALLKVFFGGVNILPIKNFFIYGYWENILLWVSIICFLVVPIVAIIVWIIRRVIKAKAYRGPLNVAFGVLWSIGWIGVFLFASLMFSNFKNRSIIEEQNIVFNQPSNNKLIVTVAKDNAINYSNNMFDMNWDDEEDFDDNSDIAFCGTNSDSLLLRNVRINLTKSNDDKYHLKLFKFSRGKNAKQAQEIAQKINFNFTQNDSIITLPTGIFVTEKEKFRNQQVLVIIEVPQGKKIQMDGSIDIYHWFDLNINRKHRLSINWNEEWNNSLHWDKDEEMIMGEKDLRKTNNSEPDIEEKRKEIIKEKEFNKTIDSTIIKRTTKVDVNKNTTPLKKTTVKQIYLANILMDKFSI